MLLFYRFFLGGEYCKSYCFNNETYVHPLQFSSLADFLNDHFYVFKARHPSRFPRLTLLFFPTLLCQHICGGVAVGVAA